MVNKIYIVLAALAILGAVAFTSYTKGFGDAKIAALEHWSSELAERQSEAWLASEELAADNNKALNNKQNEIKKLNSRIAILTRQLQNRPSRSDSPPPSGAPQTCTGRELYREDGQFLAGEASAAEELRIERDYYYERYEAARQQLEKLRNGKN